MLMLARVIMAAVLIVLSGCASVDEAVVNYDSNPKINTKGYKTYAWLSEKHALAAPEDVSPVLLKHISTAIETKLEQKGYLKVDAENEADFAISFTVGSREQVKVTSYPVTYNSFGWGYGYYGANLLQQTANDTLVDHYTEGTLAIDIYDVKTKQPAWHSWAVKRILDNDSKNSEQIVNTIVTDMLSKFR